MQQLATNMNNSLSQIDQQQRSLQWSPQVLCSVRFFLFKHIIYNKTIKTRNLLRNTIPGDTDDEEYTETESQWERRIDIMQENRDAALKAL